MKSHAKMLMVALLVLSVSGIDPFSIGVRTGACAEPGKLTHITVLPRVEETNSRVTLLDLCDPTLIPEHWRQVLADVNLGPAPAAGGRKYIRPEQLQQYLRAFLTSQGLDPEKIAIDLPESIIIDRKSVTLTSEQIERVYREYIKNQCDWPSQDLEIDRVVYSGLPVVPAGDLSYEVTPAREGVCLGNVTLTIDYSVADEKVRTLRVGGKVSLIRKVFNARKAWPKDTILGTNDIETARINVGYDPDRYPVDSGEIIGKQLRCDLQPGEPIESRDLLRPLVVKRGDQVTIFYETPGFRLTAKGVVKEDAAIGDRIPVMNATSKRTIYCQVVDKKTVSISP
jgi:flagella basal body P-ring formation protein FlgA